MSLQEAVKVISDEIVRCRQYRSGWQSNIAMAFFDASKSINPSADDETVLRIANKAAFSFLCSLTKTDLRGL